MYLNLIKYYWKLKGDIWIMMNMGRSRACARAGYRHNKQAGGPLLLSSGFGGFVRYHHPAVHPPPPPWRFGGLSFQFKFIRFQPAFQFRFAFSKLYLPSPLRTHAHILCREVPSFLGFFIFISICILKGMFTSSLIFLLLRRQ